MTSMKNPAAFFAAVREEGLLGTSLEQHEVGGLNAVLDACGKANWGARWTAYALATADHETNGTMKPVREAYWLSEEWRKKNLRYYPWYGRGYVQITWERNYQKADKALGLRGSLMADKDLAMRPDIAAQIMTRGMEEGWFTGKKLIDYINNDKCDYRNARRIINGTDKADQIAGEANGYLAALRAGGWS